VFLKTKKLQLSADCQSQQLALQRTHDAAVKLEEFVFYAVVSFAS
jgi:hypothetical protein